MIQHFILTRSDYSTADPEFAERRRQLTERFTRLAIEAQTRKDFSWKLVGRTREQCGWNNLNISPETTHVLTTRVDDDDVIYPDFVERLRSAVTATDNPTVYVFPWGLVRDLERRTVYQREYKHNQFASLLTPVSQPRTVYCEQHTHLHKRFPVAVVDRKLAWEWVLHSDQLSQQK